MPQLPLAARRVLHKGRLEQKYYPSSDKKTPHPLHCLMYMYVYARYLRQLFFWRVGEVSYLGRGLARYKLPDPQTRFMMPDQKICEVAQSTRFLEVQGASNVISYET